jgi:hypothetical protein
MPQVGQDAAKPRGCWADGPEADLLAEGFAANPTALCALQQRAGFTAAEAAEALCVSLRTYLCHGWHSGAMAAAVAVGLVGALAGRSVGR